MLEEGIQERRHSGKDKEGFGKGWIQERMDSGKDGFRKGGDAGRRDARKEGFKTGGILGVITSDKLSFYCM